MTAHDQIKIMRKTFRIIMLMCIMMGLPDQHNRLGKLHDEIMKEIERQETPLY
jgi:hypothetical protein